jgi:hypothetical protein
LKRWISTWKYPKTCGFAATPEASRSCKILGWLESETGEAKWYNMVPSPRLPSREGVYCISTTLLPHPGAYGTIALGVVFVIEFKTHLAVLMLPEIVNTQMRHDKHSNFVHVRRANLLLHADAVFLVHGFKICVLA